MQSRKENNILLVGFMGAGKSSIGIQLALNQKKRFVDTDEEITNDCKLAISAMFSKRGEEEFRRWESRILKRLASQKGMILATGGGIVLRKENRILLRKMGIIIWLDATEDILFKRATRSKERPILQGKSPRKKFNSLLAFRRSLYQEVADLYIDSSSLNHEETMRQIIGAIAGWRPSPHHISH